MAFSPGFLVSIPWRSKIYQMQQFPKTEGKPLKQIIKEKFGIDLDAAR